MQRSWRDGGFCFQNHKIRAEILQLASEAGEELERIRDLEDCLDHQNKALQADKERIIVMLQGRWGMSASTTPRRQTGSTDWFLKIEQEGSFLTDDKEPLLGLRGVLTILPPTQFFMRAEDDSSFHNPLLGWRSKTSAWTEEPYSGPWSMPGGGSMGYGWQDETGKLARILWKCPEPRGLKDIRGPCPHSMSRRIR